MNQNIIHQAASASTISRLLQIASVNGWADPSDGAMRTKEERALILAKLIEIHPSIYSAQMRVTRSGARLADTIIAKVRGLLENWDGVKDFLEPSPQPETHDLIYGELGRHIW
jgi:hypothetical protein